jgi:hypothetical protein
VATLQAAPFVLVAAVTTVAAIFIKVVMKN